MYIELFLVCPLVGWVIHKFLIAPVFNPTQDTSAETVVITSSLLSMDAPRSFADDDQAEARAFLRKQREKMASAYAEALPNVTTLKEQRQIDDHTNRAWAKVQSAARLKYGERAVDWALLKEGYRKSF